jgi:hypothetical protein
MGNSVQITVIMIDNTEEERRKTADRRAGVERREGRDRRLIEDRSNARRLPDEFAQASGSPDHRILGLVNRYWPGYAEAERGELTLALIPVLEGLAAPGAPVTEQHREQCVDVVVGWAARLEPVEAD